MDMETIVVEQMKGLLILQHAKDMGTIGGLSHLDIYLNLCQYREVKTHSLDWETGKLTSFLVIPVFIKQVKK